MTIASPLSIATVRTDFDAKTSTIASQSLAATICVDHNRQIHLVTLADTTALRDRTLAWTQQDDAFLRYLVLRVTDGTASRAVTATLSVDNGDTLFLAERTVSVAETTSIGTEDTRTAYFTATARPVTLFRGVRYRLTLANSSAGTTISGPVIANLVLRLKRRRA